MSDTLARVSETAARAKISLPQGFIFGEVDPKLTDRSSPPPPPLGPLAAFVGTWTGNGFNTIFRPANSVTPTTFPNPTTVIDNVLELNLTSESLTFSPSLGAVPNRGSGARQGDIFLNGVPYLQAISDITSGSPTGIHVEPGIWTNVPQTSDPAEGPTLVRMGSIPHGTTIMAQGTSAAFVGKPNIPAVSITPAGVPPFPSQTAANANTPRLPQDLGSFIAAGTITQEILDDPNTVLRNAISDQTILGGTTISIATSAVGALVGGGTDNMAFLQGNPQPNADATQMSATFWIESVEHTLIVPIWHPGDEPLRIEPEPRASGAPRPTFIVKPPFPIPRPRPITFSSTQIQYSQTVILVFAGLSWPHVSVATLVPADGVVIPPSAWE